MPRTFHNLPPLTKDQANAVAAYLTAMGSIVDAAAAARLDLGDFLDILAAPSVQAHLDHALAMARKRAEQRAADAATDAIHTLEQISQDTQANPTERRRAATTLIRAAAPHQAQRRRIDIAKLARLVEKLTNESLDPQAAAPLPERQEPAPPHIIDAEPVRHGRTSKPPARPAPHHPP